MKAVKKRRAWLLITFFLLAAVGAVVGRPTFLWLRAWFGDKPVHEVLPAGFVDDASRLNRTQVAEIWAIPADPVAGEKQLAELLQRARRDGLKVAIAGARHSMGGHTIAPDGIVVNMLAFKEMRLDEEKSTLHVGAGARWSEIVPFLDARGFSPAIMQSNDDFTVGGSISVNCHGWQHNCPPIASTVQALRLMKADGTVVRCSRMDNPELFSLALGGYGLFGVILDVELRVVANERYQPQFEVLAAEEFVKRFIQRVHPDSDIGMAYGRLGIVPGESTFLREGIITFFKKAPCGLEDVPSLKSAALGKLRREVYRAQIGSISGKEVRWKAEKLFCQQMAGKYFSRNQLFHEPAEVYQEQNADRTDVLHEYFIPPRRILEFLEQARRIIPKHDADLLNVTMRHIVEDKDTLLRYADQEMLALVMLFNAPRSADADTGMEKMTQELIDAALACEGRYYLCYRLHASVAQFRRAYPWAASFFDRKRHYDPDGLFQNQFYLKYGLP